MHKAVFSKFTKKKCSSASNRKETPDISYQTRSTQTPDIFIRLDDLVIDCCISMLQPLDRIRFELLNHHSAVSARTANRVTRVLLSIEMDPYDLAYTFYGFYNIFTISLQRRTKQRDPKKDRSQVSFRAGDKNSLKSVFLRFQRIYCFKFDNYVSENAAETIVNLCEKQNHGQTEMRHLVFNSNLLKTDLLIIDHFAHLLKKLTLKCSFSPSKNSKQNCGKRLLIAKICER